ncbi:MAG: alpha/beta hydrolase family protein [Anaerolineales bacterium]
MLNTTTFPAYLRSLRLTEPVTTAGGAMVLGPPRSIAELGLRLGLGFIFLDTPQTRSILTNLGLDSALTQTIAKRMRSLKMWRPIWEDLAAPHLRAVEAALAQGAADAAVQSIYTALTMLGLAYSGDGFYIYTPLPERRRILPVQRRLYQQLREIKNDRVERLTIPHARGVTHGLFHLPHHAEDRVPALRSSEREAPNLDEVQRRASPSHALRAPALLVIHPLSGDKDDYDVTVAPFRQAGYATLTIDMPAHGENFDGPRIQADDEQVAMAALEVLAGRPEVDADRLGVMGGSMGAFFALRTAAASLKVKACVAYASPFDIGLGIRKSVRGIRASFAWVIGAKTPAEIARKAQPFALYDALHKIRCPVLVAHGTRDHICDFTASYEIARRVTAPLTVHPLVGADHEVAQPSAPHIAGPAIEWLKKHL